MSIGRCYLCLSIAICLCVAGLGSVNASETERYRGLLFVDRNPPPGYKSWADVCVWNEIDGSDQCAIGLSEVEFLSSIGRSIRAVILKSNTGVRERYDAPPLWRIDDAIEAPVEYQGGFELSLCVSPIDPKAKVVAFGAWRSSRSPQVGGYMEVVNKAWRVDLQHRRFVEIQTEEVICELAEDRD